MVSPPNSLATCLVSCRTSLDHSWTPQVLSSSGRATHREISGKDPQCFMGKLKRIFDWAIWTSSQTVTARWFMVGMWFPWRCPLWFATLGDYGRIFDTVKSHSSIKGGLVMGDPQEPVGLEDFRRENPIINGWWLGYAHFRQPSYNRLVHILVFVSSYFIIDVSVSWYPLVIKHGNGESSKNGGF